MCREEYVALILHFMSIYLSYLLYCEGKLVTGVFNCYLAHTEHIAVLVVCSTLSFHIVFLPGLSATAVFNCCERFIAHALCILEL